MHTNWGVEISATDCFSITVNPVDDAPVVTITSFAVESFSGLATTAANYVDPDLGDNHTVVFVYKEAGQPILTTTSRPASGGTVTDSSLLPTRCYTSLTVTVIVTDSAGETGSATSSAQQFDAYGVVFQEPIKNNERNLTKAGSVVPVKVALVSSCTGQTATAVSLYIQVV